MSHETNPQNDNKPIALYLRKKMLRYRRRKWVNLIKMGGFTTLFLAGCYLIYEIPWYKFIKGNEFITELFTIIILCIFIGGIIMCKTGYNAWSRAKQQHQRSLIEYKEHTTKIEGGEMSLMLEHHDSGQLTQVNENRGALSNLED